LFSAGAKILTAIGSHGTKDGMNIDEDCVMLIVFSGLPGAGKSSLAKELSSRIGATYLRIDRIEQAIVSSSLGIEAVEESGYLAANVLAEDNLRLGLRVIADAVNPIDLARDAWLAVAARVNCPIVEIEVVCSDIDEHRRRVETRVADIAGHKLPTWQAVQQLDYHPWRRDRVIIDTAVRTIAQCVDALQAQISQLEANSSVP
jgi:predicted kinase